MLVVPLSLPLGILRHIKQFQVIFQQTEAGSPYTMELPVLNEYMPHEIRQNDQTKATQLETTFGDTLA